MELWLKLPPNNLVLSVQALPEEQLSKIIVTI